MAGTYAFLPEGAAADGLRQVITFGSLLVLMIGRRYHRPPFQAWRIIAAGLFLFGLGGLLDVAWWTHDLGALSGKIASGSYFLGFLALGWGMLELGRFQTRHHDREAVLDSTIVTVALVTVLWEVAFQRTMPVGQTLFEQVSAIAFPLAPLWFFATALRLLFIVGHRSVSGLLLVAASLSGVAGTGLWAWLTQRGAYVPGGAVDGLWLLMFVFLAAAVMHPSVKPLGAGQERTEGRGILSRVALLALALLVPPMTFVLQGGSAPDGHLFTTPVVASGTLSLLVCWRFGRLVIDREQARGALQRQAERHQQLVRLGERALAGMPIVDLYDMAERMVRTYLPARGCRVVRPGELVRRSTGSVLVTIGDNEAPFGTLVAVPSQPIGHDGSAFLNAVSNVLAGAIQRVRAEEDVRWRSLHDGLTGLPNRVLLYDRLQQALLRLIRRPGTVAVLFADLDGFKEVNDTLGHAAGDRLLREMANRLQDVIRHQDTLGRFAGDEFVVVVEDADEATVFAVADRVLSALRKPVPMLGDLALSGSLGVAFARPPNADPDVLLRQADAAMYLAKGQGRDRYAVFDESLRVQVERRHRIERDLRDVTARDEMRMVYQPFIALGGRTETPHDAMVAVEALVRWDHPELGPVSPAEFIPVAEATGSIVPLGGWILRQACSDLAAWRAQLPDDFPFTVFVNLSPVQLSEPRLLDVLDRCLDDTGVDPQYLGFELTESAVLDDDAHITRVLASLKARGCKIALDDFGTGYSSLAHLQRVPLDLLKVDASFVDGIGERRHDRAIVSAVVGLAAELGFVVLAEGVETAEQLASVREIGCDLAQGWYYGRPTGPEDVMELLARPIEPADAGDAADALAQPDVVGAQRL